MIKESLSSGVSRSSCTGKENTANKHIFRNYGIYKHTFVWYNKTNKPPEGNMIVNDYIKERLRKLTPEQKKKLLDLLKQVKNVSK